MRPELLEEILRLPASERAQLIDTLWETLAPEDLPVTHEERALLDARMTDMETDPHDQSPWHEVKARLAQRQQRPGV
jgi:putative addiction module component (TIGR02574 family)